MPIAGSRSVHRWILSVLPAVLASVPPTGAATIISGGNLFTQTWTQADHPYVVQGDVTVVAKNVLTIEPGVSVLFAAVDSQAAGIDPSRVELTVAVEGSLNVNTTPASRVSFRAQTGSGANVWYGLVLPLGATISPLSYVDVHNAVRGVSTAVPGGLSVEHATFQANGMGIVSTAGSLTVYDATFIGSGTAIMVSAGFVDLERVTVAGGGNGVFIGGSAGTTKIVNAVVSSNTGYGIFLNRSTATPARIEFATIHGNGTYGITANESHPGAQRVVKNSLVTGNVHGIHRAPPDTGAFDVTYSNVWSNSAADYTGVAPGAQTLSVDPDYVAAPTDLHLRATSPVIDEGDADGLIIEDCDGGSRFHDGDGFGGPQSDMGAYEFDPVGVPADRIFADDFETG